MTKPKGGYAPSPLRASACTLVIATAISVEANSLITTDARWPASPDVYQGVKLVVLAVEGPTE